MEAKEHSDKKTTILFYIFMGQITLGVLAFVGYIIYSLLFG